MGLGAATLLLVTGCADRGGAVAGGGASDRTVPGWTASDTLVPDGYTGELTANATVLEDDSHGPQLCSAVMESLPPQCGGPDIVGWRWEDVRHESVRGTRWGEYTVVGTWDGERLTLTRPPGPARWPSSDERDPLPCPVPDGGWVPPDPDSATQESFNEAVALARASDGFAGLWIDQGIAPDELTEANANDPKRLVLVVTSTGDLTTLETQLRGVWGGNLCVAPAGRSQAELRPALRAVRELPGFVSSAYDEVRHHVGVTLSVATEQMQRDLDAEFGPGAVVLWSVLVPVNRQRG